MPLDGIRVLDWVSRTFSGVPPMVVGALGVATMLAGVFTAVMGFRGVPKSMGLLVAGGSMIILTYFIVGAAINSVSGTQLQGGENVTSAAPRMVPPLLAATLFGFGAFGFRIALRMWSGEEASGKAGAVLVVLLACGVIFAGVQIVRSGSGTAVVQAPRAVDSSPSAPADPLTRRRGVATPPRR